MFFIIDFSYAIFPLSILNDEKYKNLIARDLFLYMLLLNRHNLSKRNDRRFRDEDGYFVYYSNKQIANDIRCNHTTAIDALNNLESVGLIHKKFQGNGLPLKIYVTDIRNNKKSASRQTETKPVSFDIDRAISREQINRKTFGDKKNKRRASSTF